MCLSTVYDSSRQESVIMEYVSKILVDGEQITLTDVCGEQRTVKGSLEMVDLTGAVVKIRCA